MASNLARFRRWAKRLTGRVRAQKSTVVTIEREQVLIIRHSRCTRAWCVACGSETDMVRLGDVEVITGIPKSAFSEHVDEQHWHVIETNDGDVLICLQSLLNSM